jgi:MFS family permease
MQPQAYDPDYRHNYIVNIFDGTFFGFALGFASFTTVIPLFVSTMTTSPILIGLIPAIHMTGWQFPQLLIARRVSQLKRFKPMVVLMTIQERVPFLGLAAVAWFLPHIGPGLALVLTFALLIWQGLGAGLTANAWQNMIARVIPQDYRATFFGMQSAAANLLASLGAIAAGLVLETYNPQIGYTICYLGACLGFAASWFSLNLTRETEKPVPDSTHLQVPLLKTIRKILDTDPNFRWFLGSRMLVQFGIMAFSFYSVYAVNFLGMNEAQAGILTSVLMMSQVIANPLLGWLADLWSRKAVLEVGTFACFLSALLAWWAPSTGWFYIVAALAGVASTAFWTIGLALTLEFGRDELRPTYIGMANTLIVPFTIVAPLIGGVLAGWGGYPVTFFFSAIMGLGTTLMLHYMVHDPVAEGI